MEAIRWPPISILLDLWQALIYPVFRINRQISNQEAPERYQASIFAIKCGKFEPLRVRNDRELGAENGTDS